jgi:hypothetical protein
MGREIERRRELGQVAVRDVEADVEALVLRMDVGPLLRNSMWAVEWSGWSSGP